ncbi:hypothetical protein ACFWPH_17740 [Nocardia sp. NPDC058499]|uniref:hypothetical protein n=1 Tax=Nocardia sp. NPDC058499 TaxID=3346530 RepID=UPI0036636DD6
MAISEVLRDLLARLKDRLVQDVDGVARVAAGPSSGVGSGLGQAHRRCGEEDNRGLRALETQWRFDDRGGQVPWIRSSPGYRPDGLERRLQHMRLSPDDARTGRLPDSTNTVRVMRAADRLPWRNEESLVIVKPSSGEQFDNRDWLPHVPGTLARREVAAYRMDRLFGFGLVPPTALVARPNGEECAVQQFVEFGPWKWATKYDDLQRQRAAVLHYVIGAADGQRGNYGADGSGDLVLYDHGFSFPEAPDPARTDPGSVSESFLMRSDFVTFDPKEQLDEDVLRAVDTIDERDIRSALADLDISDSAIEGVLDRLGEIRDLRVIPGI